MPTAKSFQQLDVVSEPYEKNGKMYIKVQGKTKVREVRWYTDAEYKKMYPTEAVEVDSNYLKKALGFDKGYIILYRNSDENNDYFRRAATCRYHTYWGWYTPSTEEIPATLPTDITPVKLYWEDISDNDKIKTEPAMRAVVEEKIYGEPSEVFVGNVGDRKEFELTVTKIIPLTSDYGESNLYTFEDKDGVQYIWNTASVTLEEGVQYKLKATIKDYKVFQGVMQVVITRGKLC